MKDVNILAIESSCDETSMAIIRNGCECVHLTVLTQMDTHAEFGGVVPEIAARSHLEHIDDILEQLNDEQIKPVLQTEGAVLVLAGAGSGKTRVLTSRIAYLVEEKGVPAEAILAITFTNKAANEMKQRLGRILDVSRTWVCTIHSMCVRILRMFPDEAGIKQNFSIALTNPSS